MGRCARALLVATGLLCALEAGSAYAQKRSANALPEFQFRERRIGEDIEMRYPYWKQGYRGLNLPSCTGISTTGVVRCPDTDVDVKEKYVTMKRVGNTPISALDYIFQDGKLVSVDMSFHSNQFFDLQTMLEGRYGKPASTKTSKIQNRAGATFENISTEWKFREGTLLLEWRYALIDSGRLVFVNPAYEKVRSDRSRAAREAAGKKAF